MTVPGEWGVRVSSSFVLEVVGTRRFVMGVEWIVSWVRAPLRNGNAGWTEFFKGCINAVGSCTG